VSPDFSAATRLLVVAPHPDDETIATGLLVQQVRAAGGEVHILLLTCGDNNPWPQRWLERRIVIGAVDRRRWGQRRHAEMLQALRCLDLPERSLQVMGWPDMGVTSCLMQDGEESVASMATVIDQFRPSLIAMPSIDDRHPDHGAAHVLVRLALVGHSAPPQLWTYQVHGDMPVGDGVEIHGTATQLANRAAALAAHHTQMVLSGKRMHRLIDGPERYRVLSIPDEFGSLRPWRPPFWLRPWLRVYVAGHAGMQIWRWRDAPLRHDSDGGYRLIPETGAAMDCRFCKLIAHLPTPWIFDHWGWRKA
jgi:LmbE family N-acetylglucosaminyl deacetylase